MTLRSLAKVLKAGDIAFARNFRKSTRRAYQAALDAGVPTAIARDGVLWSVVKEDGELRWTKIKDLPPPVEYPHRVFTFNR